MLVLPVQFEPFHIAFHGENGALMSVVLLMKAPTAQYSPELTSAMPLRYSPYTLGWLKVTPVQSLPVNWTIWA